MIWLNTLALLGLLLVSVPLLVHLLARRQARRQPFSTLRFLKSEPLVQARRSRLSDIALLAVRACVIAAAAAALAHPLLMSDARQVALERSITRVVIVDTSASMQSTGTTGARLVDEARETARELFANATAGLILETDTPAATLAGAAEWLSTHSGRREIAVVSDFQLGTLDSIGQAAISAEIGVRLLRTGTVQDADPSQTLHARLGSGRVAVTMTVNADGSTAQWIEQDSSGSLSYPLVLASDEERGRARATTQASLATVPLSLGAGERPLLVVYPGSRERDTLLANARRIDAAWMGDAVAHIARDAGVAAAAEREFATPDANQVVWAPASGALIVAARSPTGVPLAFAAAIDRNGQDHLALFFAGRPGTLLSAALTAAALRALSPATGAHELEPRVLSDSVLALLQRPASSAAATVHTDRDGASDARWLWLLALLLLGAEWMLRRRPLQAQTGEAAV